MKGTPFLDQLGLRSIAKKSRRVSSVPLFSLSMQVSFVGVRENFEHLNAGLKSSFNFLQMAFCKLM